MRRLSRPALGRLHAWLGFNLCLLLGLVALTGTLASVAPEIDWLLQPVRRVAASYRPPDWPAWLSAAQAAQPGWTIYRLERPAVSFTAAEAHALRPDGARRKLFIDPVTGRVQGETSYFDAKRWLRMAHRNWMLPASIGIPLVTAPAPPLLALTLAGAVRQRWSWRLLLSLPRRRTAKLFWGDLHRLAGFWMLPFLLVIGLTGSWYLAERLGGAAPKPALPAPRAVVTLDGPGLAEVLAAGARAWPGLQVTAVDLGERVAGTVILEGQTGAILADDTASRLVLTAEGAVIGGHDARQLSLHQRIAAAADPLHFGTFGGAVSRYLWCGFGAVFTGLCVSGAWLYGRQLARAQPGIGPTWQRVSTALGVRRLVLGAVILAVLLGTWPQRAAYGALPSAQAARATAASLASASARASS